MSDTALASQETDPLRPDTEITEEYRDSDRYDGSRTAPDIQYEIMRRHKADMSINAIARSVGCDDRTVKAVIRNWGTSQHTLRLQAHRSQVVDCLILGMHSAAEKGKLDSVLSLSDRLGITEPVKSGNQVNVGVQVVLNGGEIPKELGHSPAKVSETSETLAEQAQSDQGPIMTVPLPVANQPLTTDTQGLIGVSGTATLTQAADVSKPEGEVGCG